MKILKKILLVIVIIIAIPLIIALFVKKDFAVEREITINKPKQEVFAYVKYLKNQDNYGSWNLKDPGMKKEYKGTDGTVGFVSAWDSKNDEVGKGEQEIVGISEGERVDSKLRFDMPFGKIENDAYMVTEASGGNQTKVKWGIKGTTPYPLNITSLFMDMDAMVGKDFEAGLGNLKSILEK